MPTKSVIRLDDIVPESVISLSARKKYYMVYVITDRGTKLPCVLSIDEVMQGIERATITPSAVTGLTLYQKIYHCILNMVKYKVF